MFPSGSAFHSQKVQNMRLVKLSFFTCDQIRFRVSRNTLNWPLITSRTRIIQVSTPFPFIFCIFPCCLHQSASLSSFFHVVCTNQQISLWSTMDFPLPLICVKVSLRSLQLFSPLGAVGLTRVLKLRDATWVWAGKSWVEGFNLKVKRSSN